MPAPSPRVRRRARRRRPARVAIRPKRVARCASALAPGVARPSRDARRDDPGTKGTARRAHPRRRPPRPSRTAPTPRSRTTASPSPTPRTRPPRPRRRAGRGRARARAPKNASHAASANAGPPGVRVPEGGKVPPRQGLDRERALGQICVRAHGAGRRDRARDARATRRVRAGRVRPRRTKTAAARRETQTLETFFFIAFPSSRSSPLPRHRDASVPGPIPGPQASRACQTALLHAPSPRASPSRRAARQPPR